MSNDNIMAFQAQDSQKDIDGHGETRSRLEEWERKEREALDAGKPLNSGFVLLDRGPNEWDSELWDNMLEEDPYFDAYHRTPESFKDDPFFNQGNGFLGNDSYKTIEEAVKDYENNDPYEDYNYSIGYVPDLSKERSGNNLFIADKSSWDLFEKINALRKESSQKIEQKVENLAKEFKSFVDKKSPTETQQLQKALQLSLEDNALTLPEIQLNQENWNKLFPEGKVETPVGTVKLGAGQFDKLQGEDRNNLLGAMYQTLATPDLVLEKETLDKESGEFKPVNVYGKSFVRNASDNKRMVESVVIFQDGKEISISTHNKDIGRFTQQIKTADQVIFADPEVSRVASLILKNGGSHVRLEGIDINTQVLNKGYNKKSLLSIKDMIERGEFSTKPPRNQQRQEGPEAEHQHQVENLLEVVKSGKAPFLPREPILGEDGKMIYSGNYSQDGDKLIITPRPAVRMLSGNILTGVNQLTAQIELDKMGKKSQTVLTWEQVKQEKYLIKKGSQSFVLTGYDKDAEAGQSKIKVYRVFAAGDVSKNKVIQVALNKNAKANAPKPWTKESLSCYDSTPVKFLGTYMAASATGARFETNRETVQQFKHQFTQMMEKSIGERQFTAIFEVGHNAQRYSKAIRENIFKQWEKVHNQKKEANARSLQQRDREDGDEAVTSVRIHSCPTGRNF